MYKLAAKLFKVNEVLSVEDFYIYEIRKKIVVYVPPELADNLSAKMSIAGAGRIGNYQMCSFRTSGTGTFRPVKNAKPFTGKKNVLNNVAEVKLEMECSPEQLNKLVSSLIKNHPYDEAVYEIYNFRKRVEKSSGLTLGLKPDFNFADLFMRINKTIIENKLFLKPEIKRLALINSEINETMMESAKLINCKYIISQ
ncbi:MAG: hypothetical protein ABI792_09160 [bacterium]